MPVLVKCPHCEMELSAPDALLGKQVGCPRCNQQFTIGNGAAAAGEPAPNLPPVEGLGGGATARFKTPQPAGGTGKGSTRETISMSAGTAPPPPPGSQQSPAPPANTPSSQPPAGPTAGAPPASSPPAHTPPTTSPPKSSPPGGGSKGQAGRQTISMGGAPPASQAAGPPTAVPPGTAVTGGSSPARRSTAKQAKFISGDSGQSRINLGADGQLPELKLAEGQSTGRNRERREGSNTLLLVLVFGFSFGMSILMLFLPDSSSGPGETTKSEALESLQNHYINNQPPPLEPYQRLLREAKQARSRGDLQTERARYRRVLDMLHAEGKNKFKGVTGVPSGTVPPNDDHLERLLSTLLAE